ncbi:uncharacterized protein LOC142640107 [Castanea sativa]|uniref:uncharacterized protein LOC142640107 n=1 Tax=Castanea sativa TaxID=21020 RepID=UPI003F64F05F
MAKQDGRRPHEVQPESSLSVPPGMRAYHQGLQDFVESFGATTYNSTLISFDGKVVIPRGQIRLPMQAGSEVKDGRLHHGGCLLSLHGHCGKTLASCPGSCFFDSASEGKFLGYMVTHRGIKFNPDQIKVINNLQPSWNPKEVQKLTGMTAALNQFISRLADRPEMDEDLFAYVAVASYAESEVCYFPLEKAILAVVHATRKILHYFQSHTIVVLTQLPLKLLLQSVDYTGRIAKWGTILGAFDIKYMPHTSIRGQVLADLMAEFAKPSLEENVKRLDMDEKSVGMISLKESLLWKVYIMLENLVFKSRVGLVLVSSEITIKKSLRLGFSTTNNEVVYEALLVGMIMVQKMGEKSVEIFSDSRLIVGQVGGELEARDPRMQEYLNQQLEYSKKSYMKGFVKATQETGLCITGHSVKGSFPKAVGNKRCLLVGTDYFTKWVEAKPLANIKDMDARRFFWKNIVTQFGFHRTLILDNGLQFDSKAFRRYCFDLGITNRYSTLTYPQRNEQVEAVNKVIVSGFKKRLDDAKRKWVEKLSHVLWMYRTTP